MWQHSFEARGLSPGDSRSFLQTQAPYFTCFRPCRLADPGLLRRFDGPISGEYGFQRNAPSTRNPAHGFLTKPRFKIARQSRIFVDNQTDFRRRAYNQLTLSFGLTYVLCLGILVTALANHRLSAVVFVWIALVLLVLDVITLGWIAKTRKKVTADESQK